MGGRPGREQVIPLIVVDTSVWIDYFADRPDHRVDLLTDLVRSDETVALTDVVLTEILQGLRSEAEARRVEEHLSHHPVL